MSLTLNMVGGGAGGLKDSDAVLNLTVPTGSAVVMTKGLLSITPTIWTKNSDNTLDCAIFIIPASMFDDQNAWTVTASLGTSTASKTIVIDSAKEYDMELSYRFWLYRAGDISGWTPKGWKANSQWTATAPVITYNADSMGLYVGFHSGIAYHTEIVDLTDYSAVTAHGTFTLSGSSSYGNGIYILPNVGGSGLYPSVAVAKAELTTITTYSDYDLTVDVYSLTGEYYVALGISHGNGNTNYEVDGVYAYE